VTRPSPIPRTRIDTVDDALDWLRERRGLYTGEIGDVATLILGRWEMREHAHDDAMARLWEQRFAAARLRDFLNWSARELDALDEAWGQLEARAAAMYFEAEEVLNEDTKRNPNG
jgi:hypothetical protein